MIVLGAVKYLLEISTDPEFKQLVEEAWLDSANADLMSLRIDALEPYYESQKKGHNLDAKGHVPFRFRKIG